MKSKACKDQQCRRAGQLLPLTAFPRNQNMSDGRFSYCRECAGRRTKEYRARVKAKKAAQPKPPKPPKVERKPTVIAKGGIALSKVYDAICSGHRTIDAIQWQTELDYDTIGEALTELIFEARGVRIINREFVLIEEIHLAA